MQGGAGSIPDQEAKILHASWPRNQNIKLKQFKKKKKKNQNTQHKLSHRLRAVIKTLLKKKKTTLLEGNQLNACLP